MLYGHYGEPAWGSAPAGKMLAAGDNLPETSDNLLASVGSLPSKRCVNRFKS